MENKYKYYKVLQQNWNNGWDDIAFFETDSSYSFRTPEEKELFRGNVRDYRKNQPTIGLRVIGRKESVSNN